MSTYNSMSGLPTYASSSEAMAMKFGSAHSQSMMMGLHCRLCLFGTSYGLVTFSSSFEDPISYSTRQQFDPPPNQDASHEESSPQEPDNKLLGFSAPVANATIINKNNQFLGANMTAELYGMFFVAKDVFGGEYTGRPMELTCYRRNLWQCSGQITLPRGIRNIVNEQGQHIQIFELVATIAAIESIEGKATEITSMPWKNANP
ncbi:hypothetical protein DER44DRAFT_852440 [Fusarium oxysporum]|nr:hypothetical protein DER44DRAFT_852440 [Fusarium oxysporum]